MRAKTAVVACATALLFVLSACSSTGTTGTTAGTEAPAATSGGGTTEKPAKSDTTEKKRDTDTTRKRSTDTTEKSGTTRTTKKSNNESLKEQVRQLDKGLGVDLTDDEISCLAGFFEDDPSLADSANSSGTPTPAQAEKLFDAISSCIPKAKFINIVIQQLKNQGGYTQSQLDCLAEQLDKLSADDMAAIMAQDQQKIQEFTPMFEECATA